MVFAQGLKWIPGNRSRVVAICDGLSSVDCPGAGDRRVSSSRDMSFRVGISLKCENRPQLVWGGQGLGVKSCRVSVCSRGDEGLAIGPVSNS